MQKRTFATALIAVSTAASDILSTSIGKFTINNPAFLNIEQWPDSEPFLLTTSFGMFSAGKLHVVENISTAVASKSLASLSPVTLSTPDFLWPNFAKTVPLDVFG
jgi:hypothetical protein